ncbi:hypothetical protein AB0J72_52735 [Dactylosporangium sp. NPDC049742]
MVMNVRVTAIVIEDDRIRHGGAVGLQGVSSGERLGEQRTGR